MYEASGPETSRREGQGGGAAGLDAFIARWGTSAGAERANYQLFLAELCDLLGVPRPDPSVADEAAAKPAKRGKRATKKSAAKEAASKPAKQARAKAAKATKHAWPKDLAEQTRAVRGVLTAAGEVVTAADLARQFEHAKAPRVEEILDTLVDPRPRPPHRHGLRPGVISCLLTRGPATPRLWPQINWPAASRCCSRGRGRR